MIPTIIISILTCFSMVLVVLKKPSVKIGNHHLETFFIPPLIGSFLILTFRLLPLANVSASFFSNIPLNPLKILVLFVCVSLLSITLDELGFFNYIAIKAVNRFNKSQYNLFFMLYALIAILTVFTSNDIVILTFTPFICYLCKKTKVNPLPYLLMEFIVANTYSMTLLIGNPTNIYLSTVYQINFLSYLKIMFLPTIASGLTSIVLLLLFFRRDLKKPLAKQTIENIRIHNKALTIITIVHLTICTILLAISSYINLEMWIICLIFAFSLSTFLIIYCLRIKSFTLVRHVYRRLPWSLIPFIASMFIIVLALVNYDVTKQIADIFTNLAKESKISSIFVYGITSTLSCNIINNIPMTLAYSQILFNATNFPLQSVYATIIGSNLGAFLTPIGALAGIMWMNILKKQQVDISFMKFMKYGTLFCIPMLVVALLVLSLIA